MITAYPADWLHVAYVLAIAFASVMMVRRHPIVPLAVGLCFFLLFGAAGLRAGLVAAFFVAVVEGLIELFF